MSALSGQRLAQLTIKSIETMRNENNAMLFFQYVNELSKQHMIGKPVVGRKRKRPKYSLLHYLDGCPSSSDAHDPITPDEMYRAEHLF